ncbi:hypothetical protein BDY19DRAFT_941100 [Irpex rosettiformis]|uniref:Uncharacterized protein n=1 Tax=Irpex rosettiformis TaxID=378272 RepID=A0ACB8U678_9APHY|nr:hypothetical protein BDY19DRAFT_941100 [Irpex rosettiformis]
MERLQERAGKSVVHPPVAVASPVPQRVTNDKTIPEKAAVKSGVSRVKVEEIERPMTPEPTPASVAKGGLSSLLDGSAGGDGSEGMGEGKGIDNIRLWIFISS